MILKALPNEIGLAISVILIHTLYCLLSLQNTYMSIWTFKLWKRQMWTIENGNQNWDWLVGNFVPSVSWALKWTAIFWRFSVIFLKDCFAIILANIYQSIWTFNRWRRQMWTIEIRNRNWDWLNRHLVLIDI